MVSSFLQVYNTSVPRLVTVSGIVISVSSLDSNALPSIVVTLAGIVILLSELSQKAASPMVLMLSGSVISEIPVTCEKARRPTAVTSHVWPFHATVAGMEVTPAYSLSSEGHVTSQVCAAGSITL